VTEIEHTAPPTSQKPKSRQCKRPPRTERGDLIGKVGSTGRSEAPHLHYEVIKNGEHINPIHFYYGNLTPSEYADMLHVSTQENQSLD